MGKQRTMESNEVFKMTNKDEALELIKLEIGLWLIGAFLCGVSMGSLL